MKLFASYFLNNIERRFAYNDIVKWMQILDISNINEVDEVNYIAFGRDELEKLITFYGYDKKVNSKTTLEKISPDDVRGEYRLFKRMIRSNHKKIKNDEFWITMKNKHENSFYPNIYKLGMIENFLIISPAICERGFSHMNVIKNDVRSCLGDLIIFINFIT